jgi:hypothetical protein
MKTLLVAFFLLLLGFLAWPFVSVYQLNQALETNDTAAIEELIDIESVKQEIKRKMNKEVESSIGEVSNGFVEWLQNGIQRLGSNAVEQMVGTQWAISQLRSHNPDRLRGGFLDQLSYAFFDGPDSLLLRIGELGDKPVHARLSLQGTQWRITAIYN